MPDYLAAAERARTPSTRTRFRILGCESCVLAETRTNAVPWSGPTTSKVALLGEAPGAAEDKQGIPFVGAAGRLLNKMLAVAGLPRESVMVMNSVCCRPPGNRTPTTEEQNACRRHLNAQLDLSEATVIVLLGGAAISTVTGDPSPKVSEYQGKPFWASGRIWLPTFHPAYILRNRPMRFAVERDLKLAREIVEGIAEWPTAPPPEANRLLGMGGFSDALAKKGYVLIYSPVLEDTIVVVMEGAKVPRRHTRHARYTLTEVAAIGGLSHLEELRSLHWVKRELGGKVVGAKV